MKKLLVLLLIGAFALAFVGCGGGQQKVEPETQPVVEPEPQETTPEPQPETQPEPEVVPVKDSDFGIVYFDFDKYNLVDSAKRALEMNADVMKKNASVMVLIEGHCDERGTVEYNLALGEKRAKSSADYLKNLGVAPGRIETISYGEERPAMQGSNEGAWAKNRRCEFRVTSQ